MLQRMRRRRGRKRVSCAVFVRGRGEFPEKFHTLTKLLDGRRLSVKAGIWAIPRRACPTVSLSICVDQRTRPPRASLRWRIAAPGLPVRTRARLGRWIVRSAFDSRSPPFDRDTRVSPRSNPTCPGFEVDRPRFVPNRTIGKTADPRERRCTWVDPTVVLVPAGQGKDGKRDSLAQGPSKGNRVGSPGGFAPFLAILRY